MHRIFYQKGQLTARFPNDPHIPSANYTFRKQNVNVCKQNGGTYKPEIIRTLEQCHKSYWKLLENFNNKETVITEPSVSEYMKHLMIGAENFQSFRTARYHQ